MNKVVTTIYTPKQTDLTYNFKFMLLSTDKRSVYLGNHVINKLNITNKTYVTLAGLTQAPYIGASDGLGTSASFNSITGAALWKNESYLIAVDNSNCNIRLLNLSANSSYAVTTLAGSLYSSCGLLDGVGTAANFRYPLDIAIDPTQSTAYISDSGNYVIRAINLNTTAVTTVVGNGGPYNIDGVGTAASIDPRYLAISPDGSKLYVKTSYGIRAVALATFTVTTLTSSLPFSPYQLVASSASPSLLYFGSKYEVNSFFVPSGQAFDIAGSGQPVFADGVGAAAGFLLPALVSLINETLAPAALCPTCTVCPAGQYGVCNSTASVCLPCATGLTSVAGASACTPCLAGTYSVSGGLCATCPAGAFSGNASTACYNCSAGTYMPAAGLPACLNCSAGTYSALGATACGKCTNLTANATWLGAGTNSTNCAFGCRAGFNLVTATGVCSPCGVGTYATPGSTVCAACTNLPAEANYTSVGSNATNCRWACMTGYHSNGSACLPCPAGTRTVGSACVSCPAGSYSAAAASLCLACNQGNYSLGGASACTTCSNAGAYTLFVGRGTSASCQFVCKAGSFLSPVNRTCLPCYNGTYSPAGATACRACGYGTWSGSGASACANCTHLQITAGYGAAGIAAFPYIAQDGFGVTGITCVG